MQIKLCKFKTGLLFKLKTPHTTHTPLTAHTLTLSTAGKKVTFETRQSSVMY